ncbi:MAG: SagB/ThcOx family dehydrogenase [Acidobacteriota bacterium]
MKKIFSWLAIVLVAFLMFPSGVNNMQSNPDAPGTIQLPEPARSGVVSLEEALAQRRSVREFLPDALTTRQLSQLLWAAQGITASGGYRTAPSAGALYPLEIYVAIPIGFYHHIPARHRLTLVSATDMRQPLYRAALEQEAIRDAGAVFVIAAVYERTAQKYGATRGERYVHIEAGHAAQNLLLEAGALGLGAVPMGAFRDADVQKVLSLPRNHQPLYLIPVGKPR